MTIKTKKILISTMGLLSITGAALPAIACGKTSKNIWASEKKIYVAVDGNQKNMYEVAIAEYKKTDSFKKNGFDIVTIDKDVWGALDVVDTVGIQDRNAPDIFYMPNDRFTSMLQKKALMPWTTAQADALLSSVDATDAEKTAARAYGSFNIAKSGAPDVRFFTMPHNREGTIIASRTDKEKSTMRSEIDSKGLLGLMNDAKGLFRLQDLWYGSAFFGKNDLNKKMLYGDGSVWSSGFIKTDENHAQFKLITDAMSDMWFEPTMKAFAPELMNSGGILATNPWATSPVSGDDLKAFLQNDMGAVNNKLMSLVEDKKLDYMHIGTWDGQTVTKRGISNFVNFGTDIDGTDSSTYNNIEFKQAAGTWSHGINARNNGASQDRIDAIFEFLKQVYSTDASVAYYLQDTKIPYFGSLQTKVKTGAAAAQGNDVDAAVAVYDKMKAITDLDPVLEDASTKSEKVFALHKWVSEKGAVSLGIANVGSSLHTEWDGSATKEEYIAKEVYTNLNADAKQFVPSNVNGIKSTVGLRDMTATILGLTKNEMEVNAGKAWLVAKADLKDATNEKLKEAIETDDTFHIRKIAKIWTGFNGDNNEEKRAVLNKFAIDASSTKTAEEFTAAVNAAATKFATVVATAITEAKSFRDSFTKDANKATATDAAITNTVTDYFNNHWNAVLFEGIRQHYDNNFLVKFEIIPAVGETAALLFGDIKDATDTAVAATSVGQVFDVITSTTGSTGTFTSQSTRFDSQNPQFGGVWGLWNDQTFGNKIFLEETAKKILETAGAKSATDLETEFKTEVTEKLHKLYTDKVAALKSANAEGKITW